MMKSLFRAIKGLLLAVLLLGAVLVFALPGGLGLLAQYGHTRVLSQAQSLGYPVTATFERGWFGSEAHHVHRLDDPRWQQIAAAVTGEYEGTPMLVLDTRLHHGPLPATDRLRGTWLPAWSEAHTELAVRAPSGRTVALPGHVTSRLAPDTSTHFHYEAQPGTQTLHQSLEAAWTEMDVRAQVARGAGHVLFDGTIGAFELRDPTASLKVDTLRVEGVQKQSPSGLWAGTTEWHAAALTSPGVQANDVVLRTVVAETDGKPVYRIDGQIARLHSNDVSGENVRVDLEVRNVDSATLAEIMAIVAEGRFAELFAQQHRPLLRRAFAGGPEVTLHNLEIPTGDADIEGTARLSVAEGTDPELAGTLSGAIEAETDLAVPRSLVDAFAAASGDQTRTAIELMIRMRVLKPEGSRYRVKAKYAGGRLEVNGFPVPVPVF